jgi:hypothetical protein
MSAQLIQDRAETITAQTSTAQPAVATSQGRVRGAWRRVRQTIGEMNYATGRIAEMQAPWAAGQRRGR